MPTDPEYKHRYLLDALLEQTPGARQAYNDNAEFYHGVNLLARTLPKFLEVMVAESNVRSAEFQMRLHEARFTPFPPHLLKKDTQ